MQDFREDFPCTLQHRTLPSGKVYWNARLVRAEHILNFLDQVLPYLAIKKDKADIALEILRGGYKEYGRFTSSELNRRAPLLDQLRSRQ